MNHSVSQWGVWWNSNHSSIRYKWLTGAFRPCLEIESLYAQVKLRWEACKWWWSKSKRVVRFLSCWHWEGNNQCHIITCGLLTATHTAPTLSTVHPGWGGTAWLSIFLLKQEFQKGSGWWSSGMWQGANWHGQWIQRKPWKNKNKMQFYK